MLETKHWKKRKSATLIANIAAKLKTMPIANAHAIFRALGAKDLIFMQNMPRLAAKGVSVPLR